MLILLDQDGVLADFERGFYNAWNAMPRPCPAVELAQRQSFYLREDYPASVRADIEAIYTAPGFFRELPPHEGALQGFKAMLERGHDVRICTSPLSNYRNCVAEKYEWVEQHLGLEFVTKIILTKDKTWVRGDVLIDDKPEVLGALQPVWQHLVLDQPYNRRSASTRVHWDNWADVVERLA